MISLALKLAVSVWHCTIGLTVTKWHFTIEATIHDGFCNSWCVRVWDCLGTWYGTAGVWYRIHTHKVTMQKMWLSNCMRVWNGVTLYSNGRSPNFSLEWVWVYLCLWEVWSRTTYTCQMVVGDVMALWTKVCVQSHSKQVTFSCWLEKPGCFFMCIIIVLGVGIFPIEAISAGVQWVCLWPTSEGHEKRRRGRRWLCWWVSHCVSWYNIICIVYCSDLLREVKVLVHAYITPYDSYETLLVDVELPNNSSVSAHAGSIPLVPL